MIESAVLLRSEERNGASGLIWMGLEPFVGQEKVLSSYIGLLLEHDYRI